MTNELPKITIVTPSFNQGHFIEGTILSVLNQDYPNLEYFVFDGGSTDDTKKILEKYSDRITYWESAPDEGQSHAIEKGIKRGTGVIFNWLNSDDFLEPGALFHIAEIWMESKPAAICGKVNVWDGNTFSHVRKPGNIKGSTEESIANFNINQEGTFWNFDIVKRLGGVDRRFHYGMDLELWLSLLADAGVETIRETDKILSNFRRHPAAKSTIQSKIPKEKSAFMPEELCFFEEIRKISRYATQIPDLFSVFELQKPFEYHFRTGMSAIKNPDPIIERYILKWAKYFFYEKNYKKARYLAGFLRDVKVPQMKKDADYIRRIALVKGIFGFYF